MSNPKTLLVTGGAGFIGSCFVRQVLAETDWRVINLDALTYAGHLESLAEANDNDRHTFVHGDIGNGALVQRLLSNYECDAVVNFAAESHVDRSIGEPGEFVRTNVVGTVELLNASVAWYEKLEGPARDRFRFLHVSTDEVYGSLGDEGLFTEQTPYSPNSPYSASKASSDHFVRAYHHTYGLPTLITNCSNNYGPYQFPEKLIPLIIRKAVLGEELPVYGKGDNVRDWLHVEDHCRALRTVLERGRNGETYNVGGGCELSNLSVVETICDVVDRRNPGLSHAPCRDLVRFVRDRPGHDFRYAIDFGKLESELGWRPSVSFEEGIEQTVAWYAENPGWVDAVLEAANYRGERLGIRDGEEEPTPGEILKHSLINEEIEGVDIRPLSHHRDDRGWLVELYRDDELDEELRPRMVYISQTMPGVARGPHEHIDQTDYFAFIGPGNFRLYLWDARDGSPTEGNRIVVTVGQSNPAAVVIPPGVVHAYKNISDIPGNVVNAPNQLYAGEGKAGPVDEIRHENVEDSPYVLT